MSKSSTVTVREQPVAETISVSGTVSVRGEVLTVETDQRIDLIDVTDRVMSAVRALGVKEGIVNLFSTHTTCTVFINESQAALVTDIKTFLEHVVGRDEEWKHNEPAHSDCDRM